MALVLVASMAAASVRAQAPSDSVGASDAPSGVADGATPLAEEDARANGSDSSKEYDRAVEQGLDEHERGHFEEAREHFRKAHDVFPNARTLRGLGKVEFELRNYGESVRYLDAALASQVKPLTPELRAEVTAILNRARAYVGEVHLDVQPETALVSVDGVPVVDALRGPLSLAVGEHLLEFRAHGRESQSRQVVVRGRDRIEVRVVLAPSEPSASLLMQTERRAERAPAYRKWWVWTLVGVASAGAATAIALSLRDHASHTAQLPPGAEGMLANP